MATGVPWQDGQPPTAAWTHPLGGGVCSGCREVSGLSPRRSSKPPGQGPQWEEGGSKVRVEQDTGDRDKKEQGRVKVGEGARACKS